MSSSVQDVMNDPFQIVVPLLPRPSVLSLSLVKGCNGHCVFCPIGQRQHKPNKNTCMPFEVVQRCVNEFTSHPPKEIWISENGEALLHPKFKEIVIYLRAHFPQVPIALASNFFHMTPEFTRFILSQRFTFVAVNIDGYDQLTYGAVKGIDFNTVITNLNYFVKLRNKLKISCGVNVNVLSQSSYYSQIGEPQNITVPDATVDTFMMLRNRLRWGELDRIFHPFALTWARRRAWKRPRDRSLRCAGLWTVGTKLFLDSDGNAYPCCLDFDSDYQYGNILNLTVEQIWNGEKRKRFVDHLLNNEFEKIGQPCIWCQD